MIDMNHLEDYGAKLLTFAVSPSPVTNTYADGYHSLLSRLQDTDVRKRPVSITLHISGTTLNQVTERENALSKILHKDPEILLPDGFIYRCIYIEGEATRLTENLLEVVYTFAGVRCMNMVEISCPDTSNLIDCQSNTVTECILRITPKAEAVKTVTVGDVTIKNVSGTVLIDGIQKTVLMDGANKFLDTDLIEFPVLYPGENRIPVSDPEAVSVIVQYYPIFI